MANIAEVEGIGPAYAEKLAQAGVSSTDDLLKAGATAAGRKSIAEKSTISENLVLEWVNHVDLFRIKGVASEFADLLEEAGVDTVPELAQRNAANLHEKLSEVNELKKLVRRLPSDEEIGMWIDEAKKLPRVVEY